jgi:hypothetical protein
MHSLRNIQGDACVVWMAGLGGVGMGTYSAPATALPLYRLFQGLTLSEEGTLQLQVESLE